VFEFFEKYGVGGVGAGKIQKLRIGIRTGL
jgi:hypothetical protein